MIQFNSILLQAFGPGEKLWSPTKKNALEISALQRLGEESPIWKNKTCLEK